MKIELEISQDDAAAIDEALALYAAGRKTPGEQAEAELLLEYVLAYMLDAGYAPRPDRIDPLGDARAIEAE